MTLYIIATPIGNIEDISYRAVATLQQCDYVLCEDTRRSRVLLDHFAIKKPLKSFFKFNEKESEERIIADLKQGNSIALVSDAGMPTISDPGGNLVARCRIEAIPVTVLPGASAITTAVALAGSTASSFQFLGFLPRKANPLKHCIIEALYYPGLTLFFESPHRVHKTIEFISSVDPERKAAIARELTKKFEEILIDSAHKLLEVLSHRTIQGEIVVILYPNPEFNRHRCYPIQEHVAMLQKEYDIPLKEAIKIAASLRNEPKRALYD